MNGWGQNGTPGSAFVALGQAQNVSNPETYYTIPVAVDFNLSVDGQASRNSSVKLIDVAGNILYICRLTSGSLPVNSRKLSKGYYIVEVNLGGR